MLDHVFDKASEYCANPENTQKFTEKLLTPILQSLAVRFQWLFLMFQGLAALLVLQTALTIWILASLRCGGGGSGGGAIAALRLPT